MVIQRCLCGLYLFVQVDSSGGIVAQSTVKSPVKMPSKGTKIRRCLEAVRDLWPNTIRTLEIATLAGLHGKETSALMAVLAARGLVQRLEERRGLVGGSIWSLSDIAVEHIELI